MISPRATQLLARLDTRVNLISRLLPDDGRILIEDMKDDLDNLVTELNKKEVPLAIIDRNVKAASIGAFEPASAVAEKK